MFLSIVIAVYNEERNVRELTERISSAVKKIESNYELIYVIDGEDKTYPILYKMQKQNRHLKLFHSVKPRGFANSFRKGFKEVSQKATHILTMDGDLNHQPEEISNLIETMNKLNADIVIGSRYIAKGRTFNVSLWKRCVSKFANLILEKALGIDIKDKTSGFRLYKSKVIESILPNLICQNFEFLMEILILAKRNKYKIVECPINFKMRIYGKSKFQLLRAGMGYLRLLLRSLRFNF